MRATAASAPDIRAIKAQINGIVSQVHFREGQDVAKGQLLYTIDPRPFQAALRQAEANLARDLAQARAVAEVVREHLPHMPMEEVLTALHADVRNMLPRLL